MEVHYFITYITVFSLLTARRVPVDSRHHLVCYPLGIQCHSLKNHHNLQLISLITSQVWCYFCYIQLWYSCHQIFVFWANNLCGHLVNIRQVFPSGHLGDCSGEGLQGCMRSWLSLESSVSFLTWGVSEFTMVAKLPVRDTSTAMPFPYTAFFRLVQASSRDGWLSKLPPIAPVNSK